MKIHSYQFIKLQFVIQGTFVAHIFELFGLKMWITGAILPLAPSYFLH